MTYLRYTGPWIDVADGRTIESAHRRDSDDLTVARILSADQSLRAGEVAITEQEFNTDALAIKAYNDALPPEPSAVTPPTPQEQAVAAVHAIDLDAITDPAVRAAFEALRDAALGERQPREFTVLQTEGLT